MTALQPIPGSFRDPAGAVYRLGGRVLRTVAREHVPAFQAVLNNGVLQRLASEGRLVGFEPATLTPDALAMADVGMLIEHPPLSFVSYPYEWSFEALRAAANHHLDVHLEAMESGLTLRDATAYNIQFVGARPVFIDLLSFHPYQEGELWAGYRQFCEQFLNPLLLCAATGVVPNAWYRGAVAGITTADLRRLLPLRWKLSRRVLLHVIAHAALEGVDFGSDGEGRAGVLPRRNFLRLLTDLRAWVSGLTPKRPRSLWSDYRTTCSYSGDEQSAKRAEVQDFAASVRPRMLWDLGCNTGELSMAALQAGAEAVVGWDSDPVSVDRAFMAAQRSGARFTPLLADLANPSPSQGWEQAERAGLRERVSADALMALAVVHHLVFGANLPLSRALGWIVELAPRGLVEFVPPDDVQVRPMIARRRGEHHPYDRRHFVEALSQCARIERSTLIGPSRRELFWYERS